MRRPAQPDRTAPQRCGAALFFSAGTGCAANKKSPGGLAGPSGRGSGVRVRCLCPIMPASVFCAVPRCFFSIISHPRCNLPESRGGMYEPHRYHRARFFLYLPYKKILSFCVLSQSMSHYIDFIFSSTVEYFVQSVIFIRIMTHIGQVFYEMQRRIFL